MSSMLGRGRAGGARRSLAPYALQATIALCSIGLAWARPVASSEITYEGGLLSIESGSRPGGEILQEVARAAGMELRAAGADLSRPASFSFRDVPLDRGVRTMLKALGVDNYAMIYEADATEPTALVILPVALSTAKPALVSAVPQPAVAVAPPTEQAKAPAVSSARDASREKRQAERRAIRDQRRGRWRERGEDPMDRIQNLRERAAMGPGAKSLKAER